MIRLIKILTEDYDFDSDDYVPYSKLKVGDIVRCIENPEDKLRILEIVGNNKLVVSLIDDPRDIRAVIFDEDVTAHDSDQGWSDEDTADLNELDVNLTDKEREEPEDQDEFDPRDILPESAEVIAMSTGFDTNKLKEAITALLKSGHHTSNLDTKKTDERGNILPYRYVSIKICNVPDKITSGPSLDVNFTGKYLMPAYSRNTPLEDREEHTCDTPATAATKVKNLLVGKASPVELKEHIVGWILVDSKSYLPEIYPYLDEEGVKIYLQVKNKLSSDINKFYAGTNYWGD